MLAPDRWPRTKVSQSIKPFGELKLYVNILRCFDVTKLTRNILTDFTLIVTTKRPRNPTRNCMEVEIFTYKRFTESCYKDWQSASGSTCNL